MITSNQIHYITGILEGEGSFTINNNTPIISLGMTDEDIIIRTRNILSSDCRIYNCKQGGIGKRNVYNFDIRGTRAIEWMMTLYNLMGVRRQERIRELLGIWKGKKHSTKTRCRHGHLFITINKDFKYKMNGAKYCLHCVRIKGRFGTLRKGLEVLNNAQA